MRTSVPPPDEAELAAAAAARRGAARAGWRLATAESCTGGLVGHCHHRDPRLQSTTTSAA